MFEIRAAHVEYVFEQQDRTTTEIRNIKAYMLTSLYNAPVTIDSYFAARVAWDMANTDWTKT